MAICTIGLTAACKCATETDKIAMVNDCASNTNIEWETANPDSGYFARLVEAEKKLKSGGTLSAKEVRSLMPRNGNDFRQFYELTDSCNLHLLAAKYAIDDSIDMMEQVLMWSVWADSWEYPWEVAIEIEKRNPAKFKETIQRIWDAAEIGGYEDYRNAYLEWITTQGDSRN